MADGERSRACKIDESVAGSSRKRNGHRGGERIRQTSKADIAGSVEQTIRPNGQRHTVGERDGKIAEWRVYCDNQPARKILGDKTP